MRQNFNLAPRTFANTGRASVGAVAALLVLGQSAMAQSFRMPSTLRYGSGLLDIPVAWVLPHMAVTGTFSSMGLSSDQPVQYSEDGERLKNPGESYSKWVSDGSIAIGIMNRIELGASIQHFDSEENGGNMMGAFARLSLLSMEKLGVAAGARFVTSPSYSAYSAAVLPGRLGYPDYRLLENTDMSTNLSPYVVATAKAMSSESLNLTVTGGYGMGMFADGDALEFYSDPQTTTGGPFGGAALHMGLANGRLVHLMAEMNGFDVNAGLQLDLGAFRVGAFAHGLTGDGSLADGATSTYLARKFGVLASIAFPNKREVVVTRDTVVTPITVVTRDTIVTADTTITTTDVLADASEILEELILFEFDRHALSDEAKATLTRLAELLTSDDPGMTLMLSGHADERGSERYNVALGARRAASVLAYLTGEDAGLDSARFTVESKGAGELIDATPSPVRKPSRNRRVDFSVTGYTETVDTTITVTRTILETEVVTETTVVTETETILTTRVIGAPDTVSVHMSEVSNTTEAVSVKTDTVGVEVSAADERDATGSVATIATAEATAVMARARVRASATARRRDC